jgi:NAD(P)-dependent dehydrogenase (short-subunit alcohol dehydrogenase family)
MDIQMKDRVALVTGGSKGIGLAVARAFAKSGATVARGAEALQAARSSFVGEGLNVRDYVCDVSKASEIKATFGKVISDFGRVDILVNNAGTSRAMAFESVTDEIWHTVLANLLPRSEFLFGAKPSSIDAGIYGFIANIYFYEIDTPLKEFVISQANLVAHCRSIHTAFK